MTDFYRRKLPHWQPAGAMYFITFRLANSVPVEIVQQLQEQLKRDKESICAKLSGAEQSNELYTLDKKYFGQFDAWLGWLGDERIAQIVADEIHKLDGERYTLMAYCIMLNHVHLLAHTNEHSFGPAQESFTTSYHLSDTLKLLKGRTARYCNQALVRKGNFWQHESYDHVVREEKEYERIVNYIVQNPVKAGLVDSWENWKFTYVGRT